MTTIKLSQGGSDKNFFKRSYIDVLNILTPKVYFSEDLSLSGLEISPLDRIVESHINLANNVNAVFNVSAVGKGASFSSFSGTTQFFVKQNDITNILTKEFEQKILYPLNTGLNAFDSEQKFREYVENTLLPNIRLNQPTYLFGLGSASAAHDYLIKNLSWLYLLNTSAGGGLSYQPSAIVADRLVSSIFYAKPITLNDALKDVTTYLWRNYTACSLFASKGLIPSMFLSGTGKYVSGTQQLEKLHTLIDVLYSPLYADSKDFKIRDAFDLYGSTQSFQKQLVTAGPFTKFLTAIGYSMYDIDDQINKINLLYDIDRCPDEFLPRIADLVSWELIGDNPEKWRVQLKNAINIYKAKGTRKGLELVLESTFGQTSFSLSSQINELYESYIPNLLYYCLATESSALGGFDTWTQERAQSLGVSGYSTEDMDTNIRHVVDDILFDAYVLYPQNFYVGSKPFDSNARYSYRGKINTLPPWELEKYYRYCRVDRRLVNYFVDRLLCFGVSLDLVLGFESFILDNTLDASSLLSTNNNWLIFTPSTIYPPNQNNILSNFKKDKVKYLPLWNGKSSSFSLGLESSAFEFNKYSNQIFTSQGLKSIFKAVYEFTPAHSIPLVTVALSESDFAEYNEYACMELNYSPSVDLFAASTLNSGFNRIAANMSSLNRVFSRTDVDSWDEFSQTNALSSLDRTSVRRRNYKNILPKSGWYDRTGFNMPGYLSPSTFSNYNTYIPLGYIPSSGKFTPITDYESWLLDPLSSITIPSVYDRCESFYSTNTYNGVPTSATFPVRGGSSFDDFNCLRYATRADCDPLIGIIHSKFLSRANAAIASSLLDGSVNNFYGLNPSVYNVVQSIANSSLSTKPNYKQEFFDFTFGRGVHQLYLSFIKDFGFHDLSRDTVRDNGGFNMFAHTFGPGLFNGNLQIDGSAGIAYPDLFTRSYGSLVNLNTQNIFNTSAAASGTYTASSDYIDVFEFRNPHLLSGVEFISPSGTSILNNFAIFQINPEYTTEDNEDFAVDNTLLKIKTISNPRGLHRVKFNLSSYGPAPNKLVPEHDFVLNIPYFVGRESGTQYGGGTLGIWIHTEPENDYVWSWTPMLDWKIHHVSALTPTFIQDNLIHKTTVDLSTIDKTTIGSVCAEEVQSLLSLRNLTSNYFSNLSLYFNTLNRPICIPNYYMNGQQVHRLNQAYSVELMMLPDSTQQTYILIDKVNFIDSTLSGYAQEYSEEEIQKIFLYFKTLANGLASRDAANTSGIFCVNGGSRSEYRYHPRFGSFNIAANGAYTNINILR